jgi:hypothetical protein
LASINYEIKSKKWKEKNGFRFELKDSDTLELSESKFLIVDQWGVTHADMMNRALDFVVQDLVWSLVQSKNQHIYTSFLDIVVDQLDDFNEEGYLPLQKGALGKRILAHTRGGLGIGNP